MNYFITNLLAALARWLRHWLAERKDRSSYVYVSSPDEPQMTLHHEFDIHQWKSLDIITGTGAIKIANVSVEKDCFFLPTYLLPTLRCLKIA